MKNLICIGLAAVLCVSCQTERDSKYATLQDMWNNSEQPTAVPAQPEPYAGAEEMPAPQPQQPTDSRVTTPNFAGTNPYSSDYERYRNNIVVKVMGDGYVVYEYTDVRIDDVATLASRYCYDTMPGKKAYLRDIYLYRNHKRRATFDCVDLASK